MRIKIIQDKGKTKPVKFNPGDRCYCVSLKDDKYIVEKGEIKFVSIMQHGMVQYTVRFPLRLYSNNSTFGGNIDNILFTDLKLAKKQAEKLNKKNKLIFCDNLYSTIKECYNEFGNSNKR